MLIVMIYEAGTGIDAGDVTSDDAEMLYYYYYYYLRFSIAPPTLR